MKRMPMTPPASATVQTAYTSLVWPPTATMTSGPGMRSGILSQKQTMSGWGSDLNGTLPKCSLDWYVRTP
jgi:hypothetical protein